MARIVVSASRRTDIPAFYMPWFMTQINQGYFEVENPYNRRVSTVAAEVDQVHSIVFWSKDYGVFLEGGYGDRLIEAGYHLYFNFTINSPNAILEPAMRPLPQRLDQLTRLCDRFGPKAIQWRFDPICHYADHAGRDQDNLDQFATIADRAGALGITTCITSFVDLYRKVHRRADQLHGFAFRDLPLERKIDIISRMAVYLKGKDMALDLCCETDVLAALPEDLGVRGASCISAPRLRALYGGEISMQRDTGQRTEAGCGCSLAKDIGSYRLHPCRHNCVYCYANA